MNIKIIILTLLQTIFANILANFIYFLFALSKVDKLNNWSFSFSNGVFTINGKNVGMEYGSPKSIGFSIFIFSTMLIYNYYIQNKRNKKNIQ